MLLNKLFLLQTVKVWLNCKICFDCHPQKASAEELRQLESRLIQAERQKDLAQLEGMSNQGYVLVLWKSV